MKYQVSATVRPSSVITLNGEINEAMVSLIVASLGYLNGNESSDQRFNPSLMSTNATSKVWNVE